MDEGTLIAGAVVVGLGFLWLRRRAQQQPTGGNPCVAACGLLPAGLGQTACVAACSAWSAIPSLLDDNGDVDKAAPVRAQWQAENDALNGSPRVSYDAAAAQAQWGLRQIGPELKGWPAHADPIQSTVVEYGNGCQPFAGAPGFSKCAQGTHSMTPEDIFAAAVGHVPSQWASAIEIDPRGFDPAHPSSNFLASAPKPDFTQLGTLGTGDPAFRGPVALTTPDALTGAKPDVWLVGGSVVTCPNGQVPNVFRADGAGVVDHRGGALDALQGVGCSVKGVATSGYQATGAQSCPSGTVPDATGTKCIPVQTGGTGDGSGSSSAPTSATAVSCPPPPGLTWDPTLGSGGGGWRRMRAGEKQNLGPCAVTLNASTVGLITRHTIQGA